ncbi:MAG TPA: GNAT family N-acetyltransferase [Pirellulales bacterium]|jgi:GNAT superfamily N-acetyltransferase
MSAVEIKPVKSWSDRRVFLNVPERLYKGDPNWIPRLRLIESELAGFKHHPFHETAEVQTFLAMRDGEVCGRVAAIINREHNREHKEERGFFGFFETVDDPAVANALLDAVRGWLAERGITKLRGPANPSMNYDCGLLVEGFDTPPTFLMPYNPPFYEKLITGYGFQKSQDLLAYVGYEAQLPEFEKEMGWLVDQAQERCQATVRPMIPSSTKDVELFLELYNRSFEAMWGFVPLTKHEVAEFARTLSYLVSRELALIAEVDGRGVGAVLGLPDYNPTIRRIRGRLLPFGFIHLLRGRKDVRRIRIISINVVPEFQRWGLGLVLLRALVPKALSMGVKEAEFSWIAESNVMPRVGLEKMNAKLTKTYRMYDLDLPAKP